MVTALKEAPVGEKNRVYAVAKIDVEVLRIAKIVASYEEKTLADYLSDALASVVNRDHQKHMRRFQGKGDKQE